MNKQFLENVVLKIKVETQSSFQRMGVEGLAVRIENEKDEAFWRPLIESVLPHKLLIFYPYFSEVSTTKGKPDMKKYMDFGDEKLIFCIDADYDYLLENPILIKPFVFHTYVYSVENYWSYSEGMKNILENALHTEGIDFDFEDFFNSYSAIIYDWLTYSIYSTKIKDGQLSSENCGKVAGFVAIKDILTDLEVLRNQLKQYKQDLKISYQTIPDFQNFKKRLTELGLNKDNAYLFLRGHDLFDRVTVKLMQAVCDPIVKAKFESFKSKGDKKSAKVYYSILKQKNYGEHLKQSNMSYKNTVFFERILSDFKNAFKE